MINSKSPNLHRYAFLRIETVADVLDAKWFANNGFKLSYEPVPGSMMGFSRPMRKGLPRLKQDVLFESLDLERILTDKKRYQWWDVPAEYEQLWAVMNSKAEQPLDRLDIIKIMGDSGRPQMSYGAPEWVTFWKEGLGDLLLWHTPSEKELSAIKAHQKPGTRILFAPTNKIWFKGYASDLLMPMGNHTYCHLVDFDCAKYPGHWKDYRWNIAMFAADLIRATEIKPWYLKHRQACWHQLSRSLRLTGVKLLNSNEWIKHHVERDARYCAELFMLKTLKKADALGLPRPRHVGVFFE